MAAYTVQVEGRTILTVNMPQRLTYSEPLTRNQLRERLAVEVAKSLAPHLSPRPASKALIRDESGAIVRIEDHPAVSVATLAEGALSIGRSVARAYLDHADIHGLTESETQP